MKKSKLTSRVCIRTLTNVGKLSKQYFMNVECDGFDDTIIIDRNVLTNESFDDFDSFAEWLQTTIDNMPRIKITTTLEIN